MKKFYLTLATAACVLTANADTWRALGNATVVDGWITPGYVDEAGVQIDPSTIPFEVPVEESVEHPGVYKLINPFGRPDFHLAEFNIDMQAADIVIDARDRTFVIIQPQLAGYTDADLSEPSGRYKYYLSDMGTYMYNLGQQREVINVLKCASVMVGNTIVVRQPTFGTTPETAISAWDPSFPATITLPDNFGEEREMWEVMGQATVTDGWLIPGMTDNAGAKLNPEEYKFTCDVAFNTDNPNLIALINPYRSADFAGASSNLSSSNVRIIFDTTDPELVVITPQFSGFISRTDNDISPWYLSDAGTVLLSRGKTKADITAQGYNATYTESTITVPLPLFGFTVDETTKMWNEGHSTVIHWGGNSQPEVGIDPAEGAVEYYNTQGIRVASPQPGQFYIRRQGTSATKVIF